MAYEHITRMENILNRQKQELQQLEQCLDFWNANREDFQTLFEYYYSDQRNQDLEDDRAGLIPDDLARGVLSEDDIFDFLGDYRETTLRMIETALHMLRQD